MNNNRGFALVEVLATIVILGIIILSFFQFFIFSQKTTTNNQDKLVAINVAQKVLEQIKEEAGETDSTTAQKSQYWSVTHPADHIYVKRYAGEGHQENVNGKTYSVQIEVTQEKPDSNLYMVTVSINGLDDRSESSVKGLVEL
jgi:prepilin-type N-terminal cleavage/methylation domain-containing protein